MATLARCVGGAPCQVSPSTCREVGRCALFRYRLPKGPVTSASALHRPVQTESQQQEKGGGPQPQQQPQQEGQRVMPVGVGVGSEAAGGVGVGVGGGGLKARQVLVGEGRV